MHGGRAPPSPTLTITRARPPPCVLLVVPAVPASQYNPACQGVKLTPPVTEYCRQYKTGPVEDIWTVAGKVRAPCSFSGTQPTARIPLSATASAPPSHLILNDGWPPPSAPSNARSLASPLTPPSARSTPASTSGPSPRARSSSEGLLCAALLKLPHARQTTALTAAPPSARSLLVPAPLHRSCPPAPPCHLARSLPPWDDRCEKKGALKKADPNW